MRQMKTVVWSMAVLFMLTVAFSLNNVAASAAVKGSLKNGTYTVSGKGKMTKKAIPTAKQKKSIKKVVIKKGVTSIESLAFSNCKKLKSVKIANSVKTIGSSAFYGCTLETLTIPSSVKSIEGAVFDGGYVGTLNMSGVTAFSYAGPSASDTFGTITGTKGKVGTLNFTDKFNFDFLIHVTAAAVTFPENDDYTSIDGAVYSKDGNTLLRVPAGMETLNISESCKTIDMKALAYEFDDKKDGFYAVRYLKEITVPESVSDIDFTGVDEYKLRSSLPSVTTFNLKSKAISKDDANKLIMAYYKNTAIAKSLVNAGLIDLNNGFLMFSEEYDGTSIQTKVTPNGNEIYGYYGSATEVITPSNVKISYLNDCSIKKLTLSVNVVIVSAAFADCASLEEIVSNTGATAFSYSQFAGLKSVKKVTLTEQVSELPYGLFEDCNSLTDITLPASVTTIGTAAFRNCYNLNISELLKGSSVKRIENYAFENVAFSEVTIPESVEYIGADCFNVDKATINILNPNITFAGNSFIPSGNVTINYAGDFIKRIAFINSKAAIKVSGANASFKLNITAVNDASGYEVEVYKKMGQKNKVLSKDLKSTSATLTFAHDKSLTGYYVRVRPYKANAGKKEYGEWTEAKVSK